MTASGMMTSSYSSLKERAPFPDLATGELSYNFGDDNTYEVISEYGTGKGSLSFNDKDELVIILDAVITATDKKYAAKVTLTLQAV